MHQVRQSNEEAFLERTVVDLKFDKKSTMSISTGEWTTKMPFNFLGHIYIYTYGH